MLQFTENGTFQLTVFSDLHFAEDDEADANSTRVMKRVLAREDPQLVILNGDLISGEATDRRKSSAYLDSVVEPLSDLDIPWASTYGNHDSRQTLDPREIFEQEKKYSNSLTSRMVSAFEAGVTNYYLPVFSHGSSSSKESTSTPALILWFFDSRGGHIPRQKTGIIDPIHRPNWVDDSVVDWFIEANTNLTSQYGRSIPSLAFVHIPVVAMRAYQEKKGVNPSTEPGINGERVQQQGFNGGFEYEGQDLGFLGTLLNTEGLMAMFSGHDHDNDWCFRWADRLPGMDLKGNDIHMCYGRHTGYGGYGERARGGRQILLSQDQDEGQGQHGLEPGIRTWIRLEDGTVSGDVRLNGSYGHDHYGPIDPGLPSQGPSAVGVPECSVSIFVLVWVLFFALG